MIAATLLVCQFAAAGGEAASGESYLGRRLVDVLREFQASGLDVIFSSALVGDRLRITLEPDAIDPRAILDEILPPLGLQAEDGPSGSVLILPLSTGTLKGRVLSVSGGTPLLGALVRIPATRASVFSGEDGSFAFPHVPVGTYTVVVDSPGFSTATFSQVRITPDNATHLTVELKAQPGFVTEVVVTPNRHSVVRQEVESRRTVTGEEAVLAPTIGGDISRVIELLPGVAAPDNSARFSVRGSVPDDVSMVMDGLELYDPYHLQSFQSPFSLIDSNVVDKIDFFGGGFTAELGDRHGAFIEISTIGDEDSNRGEFEVGSLNSRFSYEAPIGENEGAWLVSARGWYPEEFYDTTELGEGEDLNPRFADIYMKGTWNLSPRDRLSAHGLVSRDRMRFQEKGEVLNEEVDARTRNWYGWLRSMNQWTPDVHSETVASAGRIHRIRDGFSTVDDDQPLIVDDDRIVDFFGLKNDTVWKVSERNVIKAGASIRWLNAEYRYDNLFPNDPASDEFTHLTPDGFSLATYAAYRVRVASRLVTELGLRWDRQDHTGDNQISPRFNVAWTPTERSEVLLALGRFHQSTRIHELDIQDGETAFGPAEVAEQAELSFQYSFRSGLRFRLDAYYRKLSDLTPRYENLFEPIEFFPETSDDRVRIAPDEARLRGVELLLGGDLNRPFFWWVSYVRSSADDVIGGEEIPRAWDQPNAGRFLIGYRKDDRWFASLSGSVHTGWPTTPVTADIMVDPNGVIEIDEIPGPRNSARFDSYARLDFKVRRSFRLPQGRLWLTLEILNVTNRDNQCCIDQFNFTPLPGGGAALDTRYDHWLGRTPAFSVLWEF